MAGIDETLAAGSPSDGGAPADGYLGDGTARGSALGGGSSGVVWDGNGAGCGEPLWDPKPDVSGITSGGVTYHIEVQFRLDATGQVTRVDIVKGGNREVTIQPLVVALRGGGSIGWPAKTERRASITLRPFLRMVEM